jgi:hypothetical protein
VPSAEALADWINGAPSTMALALGTLKGVEIGKRVQIKAKALANGLDGVFTRTLDHMGFEKGRETWALLDFDRKGMPDTLAERLKALGGYQAALACVLPMIAKTARVVRPSTSSALRNATTGERYRGSGGLHLYSLVEDGTDIPRFIKALFERLWLAGLGWITVSACGALLTRSIVDVAVASPERLVFEGAPTLGPGLIQDFEARAAVATEGDPLASHRAASALTRAEQAKLRFLIDTAMAQKAPEAATVRAKWIEKTAPRIAERTGKPLDTVRRELEHSFAGVLLPDFELDFDDSGAGMVGNILAEPDRYIGATLRDPHEPNTQGRNCAVVQRRHDGQLAIYSLAHGGMRYLLSYDCTALLALIERTAAAEIQDVLVVAVPCALLSTSETKRVYDAARSKTGWTKGEWGKFERKLEKLRSKARPFHQRPVPQRAPDRPWLEKPFVDAELNKTLTPLDELLCDIQALEPPFRNLDGRFTVITERPLAMTHQLSSSELTPKENWLPPPPVTRLMTAGKFELLSTIEPHVEYRDEDGYSVHIPVFFASAYAGWALSKLPRVEAVLTLPMVFDDKLIGSPGLDRERRVIFRVDDRLTALLPRSPIPLEVARKSYAWLRDDWLKEVAFRDPKKDAVKAIALALTIVERSLLDARPQFLVTGDMPGGGKSTLINMLLASVTGHPAPASAWTDDEEERKKAIFSFCRAAAPGIVFDNVKRGTVIDCPHLAKLATTAEIRDRVLGESRDEDAPAKTVIILNGNAVSVRGDLSSRTLVIMIESPSADPAGRAFEHEDPIAWTIDHRIEILRHLFNILMVERATPNRAKTRFKTWWRLIGHPLELVAGPAPAPAPPTLELGAPSPSPSPQPGFDFGTEIRDSTEDDEETLARARILKRLWEEFGKTPSLFTDKEQSATFLAKDVAKLLPVPDDQYPPEAAVALADDLRTAANRKISYKPEGVAKVLKSHVTGWVRLDDGSVMRLVSDIDPHTKWLIFYVEKT